MKNILKIVERIWKIGFESHFEKDIKIWIVLLWDRFDNPASYAESPIRQLTYSYLIAFNGWLLLFPCDLSCDWTHSSIRLVSNLEDPRLWTTGAFFVALLYLVYYALIKSRDHKLFLVSHWFNANANIFWPQNTVYML